LAFFWLCGVESGPPPGEDDAALLSSFSLEPGAASADLLAYNLAIFGGGWRCPDESRLVADKSAATAGQDRRTAGKTCTLLLAFPGGRASEPAAVRSDAGTDRAVADTHGIDRRWPAQAAQSVYKGLGKEKCCKSAEYRAISAVLVRISDSPRNCAGCETRLLRSIVCGMSQDIWGNVLGASSERQWLGQNDAQS